MLSNNQQKYLRSLGQKKYRDLHQVFIVEGDKMVKEVISTPDITIKSLWATEDWLAAHQSSLPQRATWVHQVSARELKKISNLKTPNQVLVELAKPNKPLDAAVIRSNFSIYLDDIQDPGNLGTIWRIADWYGIPYIFCSQGCVDWSNPKVIQASMGAFLRVTIVQQSFDDLKSAFPSIPSYATVLGGTNINEVQFSSNGILIIGNEGRGISPSIQSQADFQITLPKGPKGGAESLNAAVATGILCSRVV